MIIGHIEQLVRRIALARYDVAFNLSHNQRPVLQLNTADNETGRMQRIARVLSAIQRAIAAQDDLIAAAREVKRSLMERLLAQYPELTEEEVLSRLEGSLIGPDHNRTCLVVTLTDEAKKRLVALESIATGENYCPENTPFAALTADRNTSGRGSATSTSAASTTSTTTTGTRRRYMWNGGKPLVTG